MNPLRRWIGTTAQAAFRRCWPFLNGVSPVLCSRLRYFIWTGRILHLKNPRLFDEKLLWLMLKWNHPLKSRCADKFAVRAYVQDRGLGYLLPGLLGLYKRGRDIDFNGLPQRFALKCTHGWNFNILCPDKSRLDEAAARRKLDAWLLVDFGRLRGERHYARIRPRIIAEEYLEEGTGNLPIDYKVYCFDGRAHCTMACTGRDSSGGRAKYDFYDREWSGRLPYVRAGVMSDGGAARPAALDTIITAAERLSKPFPFVRLDFYCIGGRPLFGEMTFTPSCCVDSDYTEAAQAELGRLIRLPHPYPR